jgi:adenylate cyclase
MGSTRRLIAILAMDVAGYSRLMGLDEEGTHERLKAHFGQLVDPKIREHRGYIVKHTGDGLLVEFSSALDSARCAAEVQRGMIGRDQDVSEERRIRFRIGINIGDVIVEEHDIFGDGVNVAARLQSLAKPGGTCISRAVLEQIQDNLSYPFENMGEHTWSAKPTLPRFLLSCWPPATGGRPQNCPGIVGGCDLGGGIGRVGMAPAP